MSRHTEMDVTNPGSPVGGALDGARSQPQRPATERFASDIACPCILNNEETQTSSLLLLPFIVSVGADRTLTTPISKHLDDAEPRDSGMRRLSFMYMVT